MLKTVGKIIKTKSKIVGSATVVVMEEREYCTIYKPHIQWTLAEEPKRDSSINVTSNGRNSQTFWFSVFVTSFEEKLYEVIIKKN